ncbi:hypothetical protein LTR56_008292 [Elasticomyces elasticus]|nr:hypothetical protein LTR56_008292 [Elasticomyces elasticus]KAK3661429.1 hypothetical protein LTR22_007438 [Elasticomyces elasticus]KAK4926214.1 hypothetical protein LTR49_006919 [Elasticomyces elasticus]KAK5750246.1 hypothetical protein LTS12_019663 [Elasticomyces elasticus]
MAAPRFRVERMTSTDFSDILRPCNRRGGDLCTAPLPICWPVPGEPQAYDEELRRLDYSTKQQKRWFDIDPTCHFVKAVTKDGEIACIARWNYFPNGYDMELHHLVSATEFVPAGAAAPEGPFRVELYRDMVLGMMGLRASWQPKGPAWVLMAMVTRQCYRKQGAASQLIQWGVEQARKDDIPAYLEASVTGKPVYEACGFKQVGEAVPWDLRPYGIDLVFHIAKMALYPASCAKPDESGLIKALTPKGVEI